MCASPFPQGRNCVYWNQSICSLPFDLCPSIICNKFSWMITWGCHSNMKMASRLYRNTHYKKLGKLQYRSFVEERKWAKVSLNNFCWLSQLTIRDIPYRIELICFVNAQKVIDYERLKFPMNTTVTVVAIIDIKFIWVMLFVQRLLQAQE